MENAYRFCYNKARPRYIRKQSERRGGNDRETVHVEIYNHLNTL